MKTIEYKFNDAKTTLFESKEHYLAFVKAWKDYASGDAPSKLKDTSGSETGCILHILYALFRGKSLSSCFSSITNDNKLRCSCMHEFQAAKDAMQRIRYTYKSSMQKGYFQEQSQKRLAAWIEPFGGEVTSTMLTELIMNLPDTWED